MAFHTVGHSPKRPDGRDKVTGRTQYAANIQLSGLLHCAILRSTLPHALLLRVDASRCLELPGVIAVLTRDDLRPGAGLVKQPKYGAVYKDQPIVAMDRVRYVGEPVAAVAAESLDAARAALDLIEVEYEELPMVTNAVEAARPDAPVLHPDLEIPTQGMADVIKTLDPLPGSNILNRFELVQGDPDAAFHQAHLVLEDSFYTPPIQHVPLEPHGAIAYWEQGGRLQLWSATQTPYLVRGELARIFGLPASQVRVMVPPLGGGFGAKTYSKLEPLTAALARKAGRPVRLMLSREEEFLTTTRHPYHIRVRTGVDAAGLILAREMEIYIDSGAYADITPRHMRWPGGTALGPYRIPNARIKTHAVYTNKVPTGAFRGYSIPKSAFAGEQHMDMIAERLAMDPAELRRRNLLKEGETHVTGEPMTHIAFGQTLERALQVVDWEGRKAPSTRGSIARGIGFATTLEMTISPSTSAAAVKLNEDGSLNVYTSTVEMGQGSSTVLAQIAAETVGIPLDQVVVALPDTDVTPYDLTTSASRSTFMMGSAIRLAADEVRRQVLELAGPMLEADPVDLSIEGGVVSRRGDPTHGVTLAQVMSGPGARLGSLIGRGSFSPPGGVDKGGKGKSSPFWSACTGVAEVAVDLETGVVRVERYTSVVHAGTIVNPALARGQSEGSVIMGVSQALMEELKSPGGIPVNASMLDYHVATMLDMPTLIQTEALPLPHPDGPYGAKGLGETDLPPSAAAVANAIARATGIRIHELPMTPDKVLAALKAAGKR